MPVLQNNGQVIGYGVAGAPLGTAGLPVLLFHGTTMNRTAWDFVIGSMPTERTYIQVEFPGSGESAMPTAPLSVEGLVSDPRSPPYRPRRVQGAAFAQGFPRSRRGRLR